MNTQPTPLTSIKSALSAKNLGERAERTMSLLSWGGYDSTRVEWSNGHGLFGRVYLRGYPTSASVFVPETTNTDAKDWEPSWLAGLRWCLALRQSGVSWYDLHTGKSWISDLSEQDEDAFAGFTPQSFLRVGRFEPRVSTEQIKEGFERPSPTDYLLEHMGSWWRGFLNDIGSPNNAQQAKATFAETVAVVLLVRTIEDIGISPFLERGDFGYCSERLAAGNSKPMKTLFDVLSKKFQSRVFKSLPSLYYPTEPLCAMIQGTYRMDIDFARLDVDPVGRFYESILGADYAIKQGQQTHLWVRNVQIKKDDSARRKQGVYYTPRTYADILAQKLIKPLVRVAEEMEDIPIVLDVAVGSGELLCAALREILEHPTWRTPSRVKAIMEKKFYGLDVNPSSAPLAALNLLRTAIRRVPELVNDHLPLPSLEENLLTGSALSRTMLNRLPEADVCLINPPFHGNQKWSPSIPKSELLPKLKNAESLPNQAFAILLSAVERTKRGGYLGAVFPSNLISGQYSSPWRGVLSSELELRCIVENYANAFEGVQSYAGLLWGRKNTLPQTQRSRVRTVRVDGALKFHSIDFGAVLARGEDEGGHVSDTLRKPIQKGESDWLSNQPHTHINVAGSSASISIEELLGGNKFHQAPVPAPRPWGFRLFVFEEVEGEEGLLQNEYSVIKVRNESSSFRCFGWPNYLSHNVPVFCEPVTPGAYALFLGSGTERVKISEIEKSDPVGGEAARVIRAAVQSTDIAEVSKSGRTFVEDVRKELIRYHRPNAYKTSSNPLVIASSATKTARTGGEVGWNTWVNADGTVVPLGGLWFRAPSVEIAALMAVWMSLPDFATAVAAKSPARNMGTSKPWLFALSQVLVPDPRRDSAGRLLQEFMGAFDEYRDAVSSGGLNQNQAYQLPSWIELRKAAQFLLKG